MEGADMPDLPGVVVLKVSIFVCMYVLNLNFIIVESSNVRTPSISAQCPLMPINTVRNPGIDPKCLSMPINADQFLSIDWN